MTRLLLPAMAIAWVGAMVPQAQAQWSVPLRCETWLNGNIRCAGSVQLPPGRQISFSANVSANGLPSGTATASLWHSRCGRPGLQFGAVTFRLGGPISDMGGTSTANHEGQDCFEVFFSNCRARDQPPLCSSVVLGAWVIVQVR